MYAGGEDEAPVTPTRVICTTETRAPNCLEGAAIVRGISATESFASCSAVSLVLQLPRASSQRTRCGCFAHDPHHSATAASRNRGSEPTFTSRRISSAGPHLLNAFPRVSAGETNPAISGAPWICPILQGPNSDYCCQRSRPRHLLSAIELQKRSLRPNSSQRAMRGFPFPSQRDDVVVRLPPLLSSPSFSPCLP